MEMFKRGLLGAILFIIAMLMITKAQAQVTEMELLPKFQDSYTPNAVQFALGLYNWTPKGFEKPAKDAACAPHALEEKLLAVDELAAKAKLIAEHFKLCGAQLSSGHNGNISALMRVEAVNYDIFHALQLQPVKFKFADGSITNGFLALKKSATRQPLIVLKCGLFCDATDFGFTKMLTMHLSDEANFNLLVLGSSTGSNNISENHRVLFGGFWEGQEIFEVGKYMKESSIYSQSFSDIHVMGTSLGGHSALYAALINDHNLLASGEKVFKSAFAYCPVIDLQPTVEKLYTDNFVGNLIGDMTNDHMHHVLSQVPDLKGLLTSSKNLATKDLPALLLKADLLATQRLNPVNFLAPFYGQNPNDVQSLFYYNNFMNFAQDLQTPTLIMASEDDLIVNNAANSFALQQKFKDHKFINAVNVPYGSHCGFSEAYGWQTTSSLLRGIFSQTSASNTSPVSRNLPHALPGLFLNFNEVYLTQVFSAKAQSDELQIIFTTIDKSVFGCRRADIGLLSDKCFKEKTSRISYADLGISGIGKVSTDVEAEVQSRWLNANVELVSNRGAIALTRDAPTLLIQRHSRD